MAPSSRRTILLAIFTLSGFSGLIYESIWTHYLKLFLGHAAYAQTLVLAIFMGGLTIGSWLCSGYSGAWKNLLKGYALAEGAIGIGALVFHPLFDRVIQFSYTSIIPALGSPAAVNAYKWSLSSLLILPQSILLGMTFPLMSSALLRAFPGTPGRTLSLLYFTNSIGAAIGVLSSGFVLIRLIGLPGAIGLAGVINISIAGYVWLTAGEDRAGFESAPLSPEKIETQTDPHWYWYLLFASLATGAASFIYEIGWIRMLSLVLGSSTHAFELMLSAFIFGLAFGGLWIQRRIDVLKDPVRVLIIVQLAMGLLALATLPLYENTFSVMQWVLAKLAKTDAGYALFNISSNAIALGIMLPATFCAGMTLPLITFTLIRRGYGERSIGAVYAMNTIGAILGVFFSIHVGMPYFGLKGLIIFGAGIDLGLGLLLLVGIRNGFVRKAIPAAAAVLSIGIVSASLLFVKLDPYKMASGVYRNGNLLKPGGNTLLFHKDGKTATVSVMTDTEGKMSIRTNGKADAALNMNTSQPTAPDEPTMILAAALPLAYHPNARTAAVIGLGSGLTTHTLLCNPRLSQVDTIEIEREMVEGAKLFNGRVELVYSDPRSKIHIDDAKTFFSSHGKQYDLIVSEPSNPWVSGVAGLFSGEFYRLVKRHLNENGLFVQWVQLYEIDLNLVASVFKALSSNFSDYVVYASNYGDLVIIAKTSGSFAGMDSSLLAFPRLNAQLKRVSVESLQDLETLRIGDKRILAPFFDTYPIRANSDYYPVLDQNAARTRYLGSSAQDILKISTEPLPILQMLAPAAVQDSATIVTRSPNQPRTQAVFTAMELRDFFLKGAVPPSTSRITPETREQAIALKRIFYDCRALPDPNRRIYLFNTMKSMVPYLTSSESRALWKKLDASPCAGKLPPGEKAYVDLFKAIGNRNGGRMASTALALIENERDISPVRLKYAVAAGMLGYLGEDKKQDAAQMWSRYQPRIPAGKEPEFLFRFLAAESQVRSSTGQVE